MPGGEMPSEIVAVQYYLRPNIANQLLLQPGRMDGGCGSPALGRMDGG